MVMSRKQSALARLIRNDDEAGISMRSVGLASDDEDAIPSSSGDENRMKIES